MVKVATLRKISFFNLKNKRNDIYCHFFNLEKLKDKTLNQNIPCINHSNVFKDYKYKKVMCRIIWNKDFNG
jgi:hypothetical protein